jgi:hypothetical protein
MKWPELMPLDPGKPYEEAACPIDGTPLYGKVLATELRKPPIWMKDGSVRMGPVDDGTTLELYLECAQGHRFECPDVEDWL